MRPETILSRPLPGPFDKFFYRLVLYALLVFLTFLFALFIESMLLPGNFQGYAAAFATGAMLCLFELFLIRFRLLKRAGTENDHAADEMRKSKAMLSAVVQAIPDLVYVKDLEGRHLMVNKAVEEFTGVSKKDLLGKTGAEFLPPDLAASCAGSDRAPVLTRKPCRAEERFTVDGNVRVLDTIKTPLYDEEGDIIGIVGIGRDITARLAAEKELGKMQVRLLQAQKMEALGHLAGGIAHDFNNIITAITGYAGMLKKKQDAHGFVDSILGASKRAESLVRSLLAFSRKQNIETKPINLNSVVQNFESVLQPLIREGVSLRMSFSDAALTVLADKLQVERVLMNLATNAVDAMPGGGELLFSTEPFLMGEDFIRNHEYGKCGNYARLSVSDTGIGIPGSSIKKIFEPFYTTKEEGKGTGFGLAVVYGIIKQHNGYINVDSEPGCGTTFHVFLPLAEAVLSKL